MIKQGKEKNYMKIILNNQKEIKTLKELKKQLKENLELITSVEIEDGGEFAPSLWKTLRKVKEVRFEGLFNKKELKISFRRIENISEIVEIQYGNFSINLGGWEDIVDDCFLKSQSYILEFKKLQELINVLKPSDVKSYKYEEFDNNWQCISKEIKKKGKATAFFGSNVKLVFEERRGKTFLVGFSKYGYEDFKVPVEDFEIGKYLDVLWKKRDYAIKFDIEDKELNYSPRKEVWSTINKNSCKFSGEYDMEKWYIKNICNVLENVRWEIDPRGEKGINKKRIDYFINIIKKLLKKLEN